MSLGEDLARCLEQLVREPDNPRLFNQVGVLLYQLRDWTLSEKYLRRAYRLSPQDRDILYNWATVLYGQGQWRQALAVYQVYLELQPEDQAVRQRLGDLYYLLGEYWQAARLYQPEQGEREGGR